MGLLDAELDTLRRIQPMELTGSVVAVRGLSVVARDLPLPVGSLVRLQPAQGRDGAGENEAPRGEIVGFDGQNAVVMLLGNSAGIAPGSRIVGERTAQTVQVGRRLKGRIINGLGRPIDGGPVPAETVPRPLDPMPTSALDRRRICEPLPTGVRIIDAMLTIGRGQRIGVFSGPGVGKSTLVASIAKNTAADVNVIALIGERGREVREFIESALGEEGLARSVVVVATGDESPLMRVRAAMVACTVAEHFRELGADVMLMMDSITRFAQAQRQIGLTVGEQPATKGYTPSVFAMLPRLLERAGALEHRGSITGLYAVLVEGDDLTEPISDAARGVLDGHISLSRKLAGRGTYPAIDLLDSVSRAANDVCDQNHVAARRELLQLVAAYAEAEELIRIGAYARGSDAVTDVAIDLKPALDAFLRQEADERSAYPETCRDLIVLAENARQLLRQKEAQRRSAGRAPGAGTGAPAQTAALRAGGQP